MEKLMVVPRVYDLVWDHAETNISDERRNIGVKKSHGVKKKSNCRNMQQMYLYTGCEGGGKVR